MSTAPSLSLSLLRSLSSYLVQDNGFCQIHRHVGRAGPGEVARRVNQRSRPHIWRRPNPKMCMSNFERSEETQLQDATRNRFVSVTNTMLRWFFSSSAKPRGSGMPTEGRTGRGKLVFLLLEPAKRANNWTNFVHFHPTCAIIHRSESDSTPACFATLPPCANCWCAPWTPEIKRPWLLAAHMAWQKFTQLR